ncbi:MAG TPA: GNAT family N-acetyltransferase [Micromonosporaceae bacterium]
MEITQYTPVDRDDVAALCARALDLPEDAAEAPALVARLDSAPEARTWTRFAARLDGRVVGVVNGSISQRDARIGHVDLLAVDPQARGRGLARSLLDAAEKHLAGLGVTEIRLSGNPPCYVWPGVDVRYTPAVCLAEAAGYQRFDLAWNMSADLTSVPSPEAGEARLAAAGIEVRRLAGDDLPAVRAWVRRTWNASWEWEVAESVGRSDAGCHVALRDGEPIGFAAWGANRPSLFGPMGTDPAAEGTGIGGVLLRRCLLDQRAFGLGTAEIGWAGPIRFYSRSVGARVERVFLLFRKAVTQP